MTDEAPFHLTALREKADNWRDYPPEILGRHLAKAADEVVRLRNEVRDLERELNRWKRATTAA